jgi:hypothetical protein
MIQINNRSQKVKYCYLKINVIATMEKLTEIPEKYSKKRKTLSFKEFAPTKKSKFMFLHFNIFRKRKNGGKRRKTYVFISYMFFSRKSSKII